MDNTEMVNAEEMGFTQEDLEVVKDEMEQGNTEESDSKESETQESGEKHEQSEQSEKSKDQDEESKDQDEQTKEAEGEEHAENLKGALAQERARRKAAEERVKALQAQQAPVTLPEQEIANIRDFAKQEALKRLGVKAEDVEGLMYEDEQKYKDLLRLQTQIEYVVSSQMKSRYDQVQKNQTFVNEIKSLPNFNELYQDGVEALDAMTLKDARPINDAFANIDNGEGTEADFEIVRKFVKELQDKRAATTVKDSPLNVAKTLPKAGALSGGNNTPPKLSDEEILEAYQNGEADKLPEDVRKYFDNLLE